MAYHSTMNGEEQPGAVLADAHGLIFREKLLSYRLLV